MAMSYPEGEVFFDRKVLKTRSPDVYAADDPKKFYSHFMVEYIWNVEAYHGSTNARESKGGWYHSRSGYKIVQGSWWNTSYGNYTHLPVNYGPKPSDIKRRVQHNLCTSGNRFRDYEKGGAAEPWFMVLPLPTKEEEWVWIDLLARIRAIYIPVAQVSSKEYPHLSTWVQVNFAIDRTPRIWRGGDYFDGHRTTKIGGLNVWPMNAIGLNMRGLVDLLTIPRHFRSTDPFKAKLIKLISGNDLKTVAVSKSYSDSDDFSWVDIQKAHSGLDLMWKKPEKGSWFESFTKNAAVFAIGFIPVAGPFMAIAFSLTWTAIRDEEAFWDELSLWCPAVKLTEEFRQDFLESLAESRKYIEPQWLEQPKVPKVGKIDAKVVPVEETNFDEAEKALKETGTLPDVLDPDKKDIGSEKVIVDVPAQAGVVA